MEVTRRPHPWSIRPIEEIVTPFPRPETTPPVTTMYFILQRIGGREGLYVMLFVACQLCSFHVNMSIALLVARHEMSG